MGRYQSGQLGRTVNAMASPSKVRILLGPKILNLAFGGVFVLVLIDI